MTGATVEIPETEAAVADGPVPQITVAVGPAATKATSTPTLRAGVAATVSAKIVTRDATTGGEIGVTGAIGAIGAKETGSGIGAAGVGGTMTTGETVGSGI